MAASSTRGPKGQPRFPATDAPDLGVDEEIVADFAAAVGNRRVGTTAQRLALAGVDLYEGLAFGDTTLKAELKVIDGSWKQVLGDTGWITPTLGSGWTNESGNSIQYRRRNGDVRFRGRANSTGASTAVFTLPAGFLPDVSAGANFVFLVDAQSGAVRINVISTGAVTTLTTGAITNLSLGNIRFDAA